MSSPQQPSSAASSEIRAQLEANSSGVPHFEAFARHRQHLTELVHSRAGSSGTARLCVLGAGNCNDLDLERLSRAYREVHLVDLDEAALERAWERQSVAVRERIVRHAPLDISGVLDRIDRWNSFDVTPEELIGHPETIARQIAAALPGPFEVVLSACILSQMQLSVLNVLSPSHRLFEAARHVLNIGHLRTLARLASPRGRALLVNDVSSDLLYPLGQVSSSSDMNALLGQLLQEGKVIHILRPDLLAWTVQEDPWLAATVTASGPLDSWLWQNGPERTFLVYGMELNPTGVAPPTG